MTLPIVEIHYRRIPDRVQVFRQIVLQETPDYVVTFVESTPLTRSIRAEGRTILEPGSPVVWFTFPGQWFDLGRFHLADGEFTGLYANILTPVRMRSHHWETTDLCLDVWLDADGSVLLLDRDEFDAAVEAGWIDEDAMATAMATAEMLISAARRHAWPFAIAADWPLERALRTKNSAPEGTP